ncbi:MAG: YSC84-related protein [Burkholderiales bacterium]|jgi:lipid-binding SYLF domain-containing protein|nr:YSC84-related protein [Burkholderiales bacterium]
MQARKLLVIGATLVSFVAAGSAFAQDKAAKQAEVKAKAMESLEDFYKADPKIKAEVAKAPGYAVFTTYGISFLVGGAGGKGLAHDNKTKKNTYMELGQASAGVQIGASDTRYLFVFKDAKSLDEFVNKGWDASIGGGVAGGTGKKTAGSGEGTFTGGQMYTLTKAGLQAGAAVAGTKVWKDKDLN